MQLNIDFDIPDDWTKAGELTVTALINGSEKYIASENDFFMLREIKNRESLYSLRIHGLVSKAMAEILEAKLKQTPNPVDK